MRPEKVPLDCQFKPPSIEYLYVVPPLGLVMIIVPLPAPKHVMFVPVGTVVSAVGCVMAAVEVAVQPFESVIVTVYVAAHKELIVTALGPLFQV